MANILDEIYLATRNEVHVFKNTFIVQALSTLVAPMKMVSSANWKWNTLILFLPIEVVSKKPNYVAFDIMILKPSATIRNRKGDNGSPCLRLRLRWNSLEGLPLTRTEDDAIDTHSITHFLHNPSKPKLHHQD